MSFFIEIGTLDFYIQEVVVATIKFKDVLYSWVKL